MLKCSNPKSICRSAQIGGAAQKVIKEKKAFFPGVATFVAQAQLEWLQFHSVILCLNFALWLHMLAAADWLTLLCLYSKPLCGSILF